MKFIRPVSLRLLPAGRAEGDDRSGNLHSRKEMQFQSIRQHTLQTLPVGKLTASDGHVNAFHRNYHQPKQQLDFYFVIKIETVLLRWR